MPSIFTSIIRGDIPSYKIAENDKFYAFLDISPMAHGHVLVVPKIEVDKMYDLPVDYLAELMVFAQPIAKAIENAFPCKRCGFSIVGLEVPHAHLHLIPINTMDDLNFTRKKMSVTPDELKKDQQKILSHFVS
ncbi:MAG: HIT family protein [Ferruginibacter sp.]|nr:HIT family protein [Ferruginibacter sp.]